MCSRDTKVTYNLSHISLEYDAIFETSFATVIDELYVRPKNPYKNVTSIPYQTLSKSYASRKIDVNNLFVFFFTRTVVTIF